MTPTETQRHAHRYRFEERAEGERYSTGRCPCGATTIGDNWPVEDMDMNWRERQDYVRAFAGVTRVS